MGKRILSLLLAFCMVLTISASVLPLSASAETGVYAKSADGKTEYTSIGAAWTAMQNGVTIVMQRDWTLSDRLVLEDGKTGTIYMNGYKIDRALSSCVSDGEVIYMDDDSSLTLKGCDADGENVDDRSFTVNNLEEVGTPQGGGLITGGWSDNGAGGIHMKDDSKLFLDNVLVAGNKASEDYGGGVNMNNSGCVLTLSNGADICYNYAEYGGGVYVAASSCNIIMSEGSKIEHNYASTDGGGIYSNAKSTSVRLSDGSSISYNTAEDYGGGYYGGYSYGTILSLDESGEISYNSAGTNGGGVYIERDKWHSNKNTINGINFKGNSAKLVAGGIYLGQESTTISDCVFTGNTATGTTGSIGGAIANYNDNNVIRNCTITGNSAYSKGSGVYCDSSYDISLSGKVIIKNNIRAEDDKPDDLFLAQYDDSTMAYIIGAPEEGSEVGIRTGTGETRLVGKDAVYDENMFFSDVDGLVVRYDSDKKELRIVAGDSESYAVYVNGKLQGYYSGTAVFTIDGTPADSDHFFKQWTEEKGNIKFVKDKSEVIATVKPTDGGVNHDMELRFNAVYMSRISNVTLTVDKPVAGEKLAIRGTLTWTDENNTTYARRVPIYWLTQNGDTTQTVSGIADYVTSYSVAAALPESETADLMYTDDITGKVVYSDTDGKDQTNRVYLGSGRTLYIYGNQIETGKAPITEVEDANISIKKDSTIEALREILPTSATVYDAKGNKYTAGLDTASADFDGITDSGDATKVKDEGGTVTIPLIIDENAKIVNGTGDEEKELKVNVTVYADGILAAPTADPVSGTTRDERGDDSKVTLSVTLKAEEDAKISYRCYELGATDKGTFADYSDSISISAGKGEKKVYVIEAQAKDVAGMDDSVIATFTYTLDNPYTVTVNKTVRVSDDTEYSLGTYTAKYYNDDTVTIGAPVADGYVFSKWDTAKASGLNENVEYAETDDVISAGTIEDDISVTALYTPVLTVDSLNITLTAPTANGTLATNVTEVSAVVSGKGADGRTQSETRDMTDYMKNVTVNWSPEAEDGKAAYGTVYTAKFILPEDTTAVKFASIGEIVVNDEITATLKEEDGNYAVYITFPITEAAPLVQPTYTAPTAKTGLKYTGEEQELINAGTAEGGKMVYSFEENGEYAEDIPTGKDAAEYTVWYRVLGNEGYEDTEPRSLTVTIEATEPSPEPSESPEPSASPEPTESPEPSTSPEPTTPVTPTPSTSPTPTTPVTPSPAPTPTTPVSPEPTKPAGSDDYKKCAQDSTCPIAKFDDSDPKAWYHDGVHYCLDEGLMQGVSDTEFAPDAKMTRAQLVTILWRMNGEKTVNYAMTFEDVGSDSWYTEAVRWAASEGVVTGYSATKFGPNDAVTREQMATILWRYAKHTGMDVSTGETTNIMDYEDVRQISSYAVYAMLWALDKGIINGTDNVTLSPAGTATRAQAAAMIQRFDS